MLYAGAGALIVSLWRVADAMTVDMMARVYQELHAGNSKAAALQSAQCAALHNDRQLHPAFWGAFQLVGDAGPLSSASLTVIEKESTYVNIATAA
jgi:CHAT domain-containing protein